MASNYTTNYNLCQWEATDQVQRTDFNADNAKLDAALATKAEAAALNSLTQTVNQKASQSAFNALNTTVQQIQADLTKITFGTYTGDGVESRTIDLGFTPTAILVFTDYGSAYCYGDYWGGLAFADHPITINYASDLVLSIVENGITVYNKYNTTWKCWIYTNQAGINYYYIAFS